VAVGGVDTVTRLVALLVPHILLTEYSTVTVSAETPVTIPVPAPIVATEALREDQVPPTVVSLNVVVLPIQTFKPPVIGPGAAGMSFTVIPRIEDAEPQMLVTIYDIVGVPAATPVTAPVDGWTVANKLLLLLHDPPAVVSDNVIEVATQTLVAPKIAPGVAGALITVSFLKAKAEPQLLEIVYTILVVPLPTPVRIAAPLLMVATLTIEEPHVPPAGVLVRVSSPPTQCLVGPDIGVGVAGVVSMFRLCVALIVSQPFIAV
jgi:hypothetical protein